MSHAPRQQFGQHRVRYHSDIFILISSFSLFYFCLYIFPDTFHDDVIKWELFPRYWHLVPFVWGVTGEFPSQRPVSRSFDVLFDLRMNKRFSKQSWGWWFETRSRSLWRHCNVISRIMMIPYYVHDRPHLLYTCTNIGQYDQMYTIIHVWMLVCNSMRMKKNIIILIVQLLLNSLLTPLVFKLEYSRDQS